MGQEAIAGAVGKGGGTLEALHSGNGGRVLVRVPHAVWDREGRHGRAGAVEKDDGQDGSEEMAQLVAYTGLGQMAWRSTAHSAMQKGGWEVVTKNLRPGMADMGADGDGEDTLAITRQEGRSPLEESTDCRRMAKLV